MSSDPEENQPVFDIREMVKKRYAKEAVAASGNEKASCCSSGCCKGGDMLNAAKDFICGDLYSQEELKDMPLPAFLASLGCGNPTALAELKPGEKVLDLGSGGGIDVLLSARRVGPTGFVYGVDMTDEMLALAERNREAAGATNVRFLKGTIEEIPLPDESVDVIISNCVINLSADKDRVLAEAFRVLKPSGRFAVSDMVTNGEMPETLKKYAWAWSGCVSGALPIEEYRSKLEKAGFCDVQIEDTRVHRIEDIVASGFDVVKELTEQERAALDGKLRSAFIRARKA